MRRIRLMSITAGFALLVSVSGAALPATAAAECRGRPATIVGSPGEDIVGTAGPDVIVTNGAASVDALGGNDYICGAVTYQVQAGPGNDHVYGSGERVAAGDGNDVVVRRVLRLDRGRSRQRPDQQHRSDRLPLGWAGQRPDPLGR